MTGKLTEAQEVALDKIIDGGGESNWIPAIEVGRPQTIKALLVKRLIQTTEIEGYQHVALAGIVIDEHTMEDI